MARLLYETIQFSPFVWDGEVDLATQFEAAAVAGFDGVGIDVWSVDRHLESGGTISQLTDALDRVGLRCVELQALVVHDEMPPICASAAFRRARRRVPARDRHGRFPHDAERCGHRRVPPCRRSGHGAWCDGGARVPTDDAHRHHREDPRRGSPRRRRHRRVRRHVAFLSRPRHLGRARSIARSRPCLCAVQRRAAACV